MKLSSIFEQLAAAGYNGKPGMGVSVSLDGRLCLDTNYGAHLRVPALRERRIGRERVACVEGGRASHGIVDFSLDGVEIDVDHFRDWLKRQG